MHVNGTTVHKQPLGKLAVCVWPWLFPRVPVNLVRPATQANITGQDWFDLLAQFARVHTRSYAVMPVDENGALAPPHPWIDEDIHPDLGYWIARDYLYRCVADCRTNQQCRESHTHCPSLC